MRWPNDLADTLRLHAMWRRGEVGGKRADLADANLARAYLAEANLAGAYLARADLARADLARAYLADANLAYANLVYANLEGTNLAYANLAGANLGRANLAGATLAGANLADANLEGARGNMREIKSMHAERWDVAWTMSPNGESWLQIGCQRHPVEKWRRGCDRWIGQMDENALDWWTRWKAPLLAVVDASPATPWGKWEDAE